MTRFFVALIISVVVTVGLVNLAAMSDGMCHCMDSTFNSFPYGTIVTMRTSWEDTGLLLTFAQFPIYTILVLITPTKRWKVVVAIALLVFHVVFAVWGLRVHKRMRYSNSFSYARGFNLPHVRDYDSLAFLILTVALTR